MLRKAPFGLASTLAVLLVAGSLQAASITSNTISFSDKATPLNFDFSADAGLASIKPNSVLVGIESYWTFTPGAGQTGNMDLLANLYSPSFASGVSTGVGFATTLDMAGGSQTAQSTYYSQTGLNFSSTVLGSLLAGANGILPTELVGGGAGFTNLDTFFANGGTAQGYIKLVTVDPAGPGDPGGGGDPPPTVPEPASMLVWGAVAAGVLARRRLLAKS
jgi:hypothetical protein